MEYLSSKAVGILRSNEGYAVSVLGSVGFVPIGPRLWLFSR